MEREHFGPGDSNGSALPVEVQRGLRSCWADEVLEQKDGVLIAIGLQPKTWRDIREAGQNAEQRGNQVFAY